MKTLTQKEIDVIIKNHRHWLARDCEGWENMKADFKCTDLGCTTLEGASLSYANLEYTNLIYANLRYVDLSHANLRGADLRYADLKYADLRHANLECANLRGGHFGGANLEGVNLKYANLEGTILGGAINIPYIPMACPEHGSFIGYKKAYSTLEDGRETYVIIKLEICEDARRSSATGRKCRCDKAKVISISSLDGDKTFNFAYSRHDNSFVYRVGEIVEEPNFCEDRFEECAKGIHFFIGRQEAVDY